ncbi:MAG: hypothetical protein HYU68_03620 [Bacteroidetes bacterium]|nr:hypothetical protein [Bacteroidota bacterium]
MKFLTLLIGVSLILLSCQSDKNSESSSITLESDNQSLREIKTMKEFVNTIKIDSTWFTY